MKDKQTQCKDILAFMKAHGGITNWDALTKIDCARLAARIFDLRESGYNIITDKVYRTTESGKKKHYAVYRLAV